MSSSKITENFEKIEALKKKVICLETEIENINKSEELLVENKNKILNLQKQIIENLEGRIEYLTEKIKNLKEKKENANKLFEQRAIISNLTLALELLHKGDNLNSITQDLVFELDKIQKINKTDDEIICCCEIRENKDTTNISNKSKNEDDVEAPAFYSIKEDEYIDKAIERLEEQAIEEAEEILQDVKSDIISEITEDINEFDKSEESIISSNSKDIDIDFNEQDNIDSYEKLETLNDIISVDLDTKSTTIDDIEEDIDITNDTLKKIDNLISETETLMTVIEANEIKSDILKIDISGDSAKDLDNLLEKSTSATASKSTVADDFEKNDIIQPQRPSEIENENIISKSDEKPVDNLIESDDLTELDNDLEDLEKLDVDLEVNNIDINDNLENIDIDKLNSDIEKDLADIDNLLETETENETLKDIDTATDIVETKEKKDNNTVTNNTDDIDNSNDITYLAQTAKLAEDTGDLNKALKIYKRILELAEKDNLTIIVDKIKNKINELE